jgi:ABC-type bacteriocin/lantibiotic exporter with double-glycine peptidase domain
MKKLGKKVAGEFLSTLRESRSVKDLFRFVWKLSARDQIFLSLIAIGVFLVDLAPLELQRRIANSAVEKHDFKIVILLSAVYVVTAIVLGGLKMALNVYKGSVTEKANRYLRLDGNLLQTVRAEHRENPEDEAVAVSIVVSEVEAVGGFVGTSFSEPVLNGGILLSIFGYMLFMQPAMAAVALALFIPQILFIPLLQNAINLRTKKRIQTVRRLSADIVNETSDKNGNRERSYRRRARRVYDLNMQIYWRKYGMNFLMNLFYHFGVIGILFVGGWFLVQGKTEIGTVIAFISGLDRMNDPWGDLVNYFRDLTNAAVKYKMIERVFHGEKAQA